MTPEHAPRSSIDTHTGGDSVTGPRGGRVLPAAWAHTYWFSRRALAALLSGKPISVSCRRAASSTRSSSSSSSMAVGQTRLREGSGRARPHEGCSPEPLAGPVPDLSTRHLWVTSYTSENLRQTHQLSLCRHG